MQLRSLFAAMVMALAVSIAGLVPAMATVPTESSTEPGLSGIQGLDAMNTLSGFQPVEPEKILISEVPVSPLVVGQVSDIYRRQATLVAGFISNYNKRLSWDEVTAISEAIVGYSKRYGVDYRLVTSLIAVESAFRRDAVSSAGAIGMGQLKPATAKWLGVLDPYDPVDNIAGTTRFIAWLVRKYDGDLESALSAYYQGPGYVDRNGVTSICMPYLQKINRALGNLL